MGVPGTSTLVDSIPYMAQPHKGDRHQIKTRVPESAYHQLRDDAAARGLPVSEMTAAIVARYYGMPELVALPEPKEGLPLTG